MAIDPKAIKDAKKITARSFKRDPFERCPVDIIVPFHGEYDRVSRLIQSILLVTRSNPYQITLVDDGSPNQEYIVGLEKVPQVKCLRKAEQEGFGAALAYGFENTKQPWVCFVHSEVEIQDQNWLKGMGEALLELKPKGVRMVSARTNNPGDYNQQLKADRSSRDKNVVLEEGFLPLYCAMCHREMFQHIKGFIKPYPFALYEDEELAFRMKKHNFKQGICGSSWVYHEGEVTINHLLQERPAIREEMEANRGRCLSDMKALTTKKPAGNPFKGVVKP
jgi:glycosyltransferase involved in cell wall biosynthesis